MMRIFLDANVIVSVLNKEYPLFTYSARILSLGDKKDHQLFTSPLCLAIAYYFAEKKFSTKMAKQKIALLAEHIRLTTLDDTTVRNALINPKVKDFEDGLEYYSAVSSKCDCIVTEDLKDFYFSEIKVVSSERFCAEYMTGK
jgi:predicted nucleic acid-binding protein